MDYYIISTLLILLMININKQIISSLLKYLYIYFYFSNFQNSNLSIFFRGTSPI